jgi:hypothetical protein
MELISRDGPHSFSQRLQPRKRLRQAPGRIRVRCRRRWCQRQCGSGCDAHQKLAPRSLAILFLILFVHGREEVYLARGGLSRQIGVVGAGIVYPKQSRRARPDGSIERFP